MLTRVGRSESGPLLINWRDIEMNDNQITIAELKEKILHFNEARDWTKWHNALHLAISINLEASELLEIFQWCGEADADEAARGADREHFLEELADVVIYCIELATAYDVDIAAAIEDKMVKNAKKYPAPQDSVC